MKKTLLFSTILLLFSTTVHADNYLKISAPPSIWIQQQGDTLTGPIIDLLKEIFSEHNVSIKSEVLPWTRAISFMKSGTIDMIPVIFYTDERAQFMEFTIPYTNVPTSVFVPKGKSFPYKKLRDFYVLVWMAHHLICSFAS